ncbi:MAG: T9SS type A sorting domain-containing protein [Bacteroidales bacterium]|nr:T9SS type A sorting domain-containing protein [Bacteroidales bacterium]
MKRIVPKGMAFLLLLHGIVLFAWSSQDSQKLSGGIPGELEQRGELYFRFLEQRAMVMEDLSGIISIDRLSPDGWVYAYAGRKGFPVFLKYGIDYEVLIHPGLQHSPRMTSLIDPGKTGAWDSYPTYDAYLALMYQFQSTHPSLCQVFSIGQSVQGRELLVARISDQPGTDETEPEFFYTSTMHGDETAGYVLMLRLIDYLLSGYGLDPRVTEMVNETDIFINPLANPDGTYAGGNNTVYGATRFNANGVDLNRNFPDPEDGPHPDGEEWQAETLAFMDFASERNFVTSANIHGGSEVCNYPWDTWPVLPADNSWWLLVCNEYADTAQYYSPPGYLDDFGTGVTNGYQWYSISGGRQDYMNYFHHCREFTLEISSIKLLPENQLNNWWEYNFRSFMNYLEQVRFGIHGTVIDSLTGQPVKAEVFIPDHDIDHSWIYSDSITGDFHRPIAAGNWTVRFSAPGYVTRTVEGIEVVSWATQWFDVKLVPGGPGIIEYPQGVALDIFPVPTPGPFTIAPFISSPSRMDLRIFDASEGRTVYRTQVECLPGRETSCDPGLLPPGVYIIRLSGGERSYSSKIIIRR